MTSEDTLLNYINCICNYYVDTGCSLADMSKLLTQHKHTMDDMDKRVTFTEDSVDFLSRQIRGSTEAESGSYMYHGEG